jgi:hypothetical protein
MWKMIRRAAPLVVALLLLAPAGCRKSVVYTTEVVAVPAAPKGLPLDPTDAAWDDAPEHVAKLVLQDLVEPRLMNVSTQEVHVRALTDGREVAFRLSWDDETRDDTSLPGKFADGCAVQAPARIEANVPAPQMGEGGKRVEIAFWRADWQASVDGREDSIKNLYPHASVDHYPFEAGGLEQGSQPQREMATRYAPAAALGNRRAGPRAQPVEDLIAEGPGTLTPAPESTSKGRGVRTESGWSTVIVRRVPDGLAPGARTQIAFAVWEGSRGETGARKMRTGWVPLLMRGSDERASR